MTRVELAKLAGVTRKTINDWAHDGAPINQALGLPEDEALLLLLQWRESHKRPRPDANDDDGSLQSALLRAQVRRATADARAKEIANDRALSNLVERDEAERDIACVVCVARGRIEAIADECQGEFSGDTRVRVREFVDHKCRLALTELSSTTLESLGKSIDQIVLDAADAIRAKRAAAEKPAEPGQP